MAIKRPKRFKKVTETADTKVTIEVEEKAVPAVVEAKVKTEPAPKVTADEPEEIIEEETEVSEEVDEVEESSDAKAKDDKEEDEEMPKGAIAQANARIQAENEEKVTKSIKDEVNGENEETESDTKEEEAEESSDAKAIDEKGEEKESESILEETGGMSWKRIFLFAFLAGCIGIFLVGLFMFVNRNFEFSKKTETKKIEIPKETPTPSPEEVALDAYEIEVLNGSGISGEAANVEGILEDAGYTVSGIGNADSQNYTDTVIAAKDDVKQGFIDELQKTLEERGSVEVIKLSETGSESDIVVTVGSNLKEEEEEDTTPTPELE